MISLRHGLLWQFLCSMVTYSQPNNAYSHPNANVFIYDVFPHFPWRAIQKRGAICRNDQCQENWMGRGKLLCCLNVAGQSVFSPVEFQSLTWNSNALHPSKNTLQGICLSKGDNSWWTIPYRSYNLSLTDIQHAQQWKMSCRQLSDPAMHTISYVGNLNMTGKGCTVLCCCQAVF